MCRKALCLRNKIFALEGFIVQLCRQTHGPIITMQWDACYHGNAFTREEDINSTLEKVGKPSERMCLSSEFYLEKEVGLLYLVKIVLTRRNHMSKDLKVRKYLACLRKNRDPCSGLNVIMDIEAREVNIGQRIKVLSHIRLGNLDFNLYTIESGMLVKVSARKFDGRIQY